MPLFPHLSKATARETRERARARLSVCPIVRRRKCARNQSGNERAEGASIRVDSTFRSTRVRLFFSNRGTRRDPSVHPTIQRFACRASYLGGHASSHLVVLFFILSLRLLSSRLPLGAVSRFAGETLAQKERTNEHTHTHTCFFCFSVFRLPPSVSLVSARRARLRLRL